MPLWALAPAGHRHGKINRLFNVGLQAKTSARVKIYGSHANGLGETSTAPASAANRNAVLGAIIARQAQPGVRNTIRPGLTAIVAVFETRKPYAGLDSTTNLYR